MADEHIRREDAGATLCSRCNAAFRCGSLAGDARCWCQSMPRLPLDRLSAGANCLCPACLADEIRRVMPGG